MNSKEAFEEWKESLSYIRDGEWFTPEVSEEEIWDAALEWAAKGQEPVALYKPESKFNYESVYLKDDEVKPLACLPLYLHPAPTPAGWKLVPIEPDDIMLKAECDLDVFVGIKDANMLYKAMIAAAPEYKP